MSENRPPSRSKIINDPVYGFITIPPDLIFDLIEHPWFQRLRRIRQLGMTHYVYPGANHTRFQHAVGAMYLMGLAVEQLRDKGHKISEEEAGAVIVAILLHDIGHGPFSHALEHSLFDNVNHEEVSLMYMEELNRQFDGKLELAISIFMDRYPKKFLHQMVSGQLDMDRLDYLKRDSFFTGVTEGAIGSDRIIKMLDVVDDHLVVEQKGIYSIEKFLIARRLMYWQVYLHKTVLAAEQLLVLTLKRARLLAASGTELFCTPALHYFLYELRGKVEDGNRLTFLEQFALLDDTDILSAAKVWSTHPDRVLSQLCKGLIDRQLFRIEIAKKPFPESRVIRLRKAAMKQWEISEKEAEFLVLTESISNNAYNAMDDRIRILEKGGNILDITEASDMLNISVLSKTVRKYFLCYPKSLYEK
ncbi:MAG: HD domain-containing protein [Bacteroidota bacterium]